MTIEAQRSSHTAQPCARQTRSSALPAQVKRSNAGKNKKTESDRTWRRVALIVRSYSCLDLDRTVWHAPLALVLRRTTWWNKLISNPPTRTKTGRPGGERTEGEQERLTMLRSSRSISSSPRTGRVGCGDDCCVDSRNPQPRTHVVRWPSPWY